MYPNAFMSLASQASIATSSWSEQKRSTQLVARKRTIRPHSPIGVSNG